MNGKMWGIGALLGAMLPLMMLCSCTVLEDRSTCANYLSMDFSGVDNGIKEWQMWFFNGDGELVLKDTVSRSSYSSPYVVQVPRTSNLRCFLWGNIRGATVVNENYSYMTNFAKKADMSADSIYFFADTINTTGEESGLKIVPAKEFATLDVFVKGWASSGYEAGMVLECANSGFYVGKEFVGGTSCTTAAVHDTGNYYTQFRCRMLRQQDTENMVLRLYVNEILPDGSLGRTVMEQEIPLGEYLEENGYDMQASSLEDIVMEADCSYNKFVVKAADWEATYKIDKEI